ncbi:TPA: ABC transporter substrate-binding protein [Streptococcus suis]|uniref:ABC transporter substrate-binding protein n=2 Tax=Streptococcus TaxID=1301 RepID=A0AA96VQ59_9STRE|nr:ABC transporter substrate-binding protein [Streptococcus sp. 29887]MCK4025669.1 ABC transporter substrate-binding protein [Streptococcus suis]NQJ71016.1 ABC transporter substrate-binding protein [Streptococcus suis]NQN49361.1 ABC transporter substrate-binding protein [Streptococcus suis]WNY52134.1 ABC transporter substrate-binding protein [Streptococcus sp. 29887]HEL2383369.1 ABC transporter substrate-binding protein [Streptococcus suis]
MKRLYSFFLGIIAIILILWGISSKLEADSTQGTTDKLVIYNWGDYIDPELLEEFTAETGIQVDYQTFDSNESMYTKIKQGGTTYDLTIPSEYMISKMTEENMLIKLDKSKIEGLENIDPQFMGLSFDKNNDYSIPYFWGTLGIVYNETMVENPPQEWEDLWSEEYRDNIMLIDGVREVMGFGLQSLGHSLNSKNPAEIEKAAEHLYNLTPNVKAIVADEIKGYMIQDAAAIAVSFSGEASEMLDGNENLRYVVPSKGSNLWFDNMVIPKTAKNLDGAYAFMSFMLRPENALRNAEYVGYSTPIPAAKAMLDEETQNDESFYPSEETMKKMEVYDNLGQEMLGMYNDLYLQFKMYRK